MFARFAGRALAIALALSGLSSGRDASASSADRANLAFDSEAAIAHSQAAIGRELGAFTFLDTERRAVRLNDYLGKPLVVNMVFTACAQSCPVIVQTLAVAVEVARDAVGEDTFSVVTIGFDARDDTPERMRAFARAQGIDLPNWKFLSGKQDAIERLTENLGFIYFPSPRGFDHLAQTTVIDAEGRVYRQVYGAQFNAPALVQPLLELVFGRRAEAGPLTGLVDRVRLFCTYYDPASGRYRFDYSIFIGLAVGAGSLIGVGTILIRAWLRTRPKHRNV